MLCENVGEDFTLASSFWDEKSKSILCVQRQTERGRNILLNTLTIYHGILLYTITIKPHRAPLRK